MLLKDKDAANDIPIRSHPLGMWYLQSAPDGGYVHIVSESKSEKGKDATNDIPIRSHPFGML